MAHPGRALLALAATLLPLLAVAAARNEVPDTIVFGSDAHYPPFERRANGAMQGFAIDLERALATAGNRDFEHRSGAWSNIVEGLARGEIDVVAMFRTSEREQRFHFSEPCYFA